MIVFICLYSIEVFKVVVLIILGITVAVYYSFELSVILVIYVACKSIITRLYLGTVAKAVIGKGIYCAVTALLVYGC